MISKNNTFNDLWLNPIWYLCKGDRELMAQHSNDDTIIDYDFFNYGYLRSKWTCRTDSIIGTCSSVFAMDRYEGILIDILLRVTNSLNMFSYKKNISLNKINHCPWKKSICVVTYSMHDMRWNLSFDKMSSLIGTGQTESL